MPTVLRLNSSDVALNLVAVAGAALSLVLLAGFIQKTALVLLYILYLSIVSAGQVFMSYQWDALLLEAGFLAIFLSFPGPLVVWLFRFLLFKFMFLSGAVKLLSGDPTWRSLTALDFHYETQPLPTWIGWYAHQLPEAAQRFSVAMVFFVELAVPFLIFAPRRLRFFAALCIVGLNTLIFLTGNYTFFNLLAAALCLLLLDDALVRRWLPGRVARVVAPALAPAVSGMTMPLRRRVMTLLASLLLLTGSLHIIGTFSGGLPRTVSEPLRWIEPFRISNGYGLFAVMTTTCREILVQGSQDGREWLNYEFRYKPGAVRRWPRWAAPHQPRLDWQMWFAALGSHRRAPWFNRFVERLLTGSPDVLGLLEKNPFPDAPPRFVRAELHEYSFTDVATRRAIGAWWKRRYLGSYFPSVSLRGS